MSNQDARVTATLDPLMDATFNEPSMQERVELIIHLLRHNDRVFTIMSDDSNVLSGFSHKLTHHDTKGLYYAEVYPSAGMDTEDIVMQLARSWGVDVDFGETAMNALFQRLPALLNDPRRAVAIIHNTDSLPPIILDGLIGFMQRLDQLLEGRVRLILTGSALLTQRIAPVQSLAAAGQVYALHLQPLAPSPTTQGFVSAAAAEVLDANDPTANPQPYPVLKPTSNASNTNNARGLLLGGLGVSLILAVIVALLLRPDAPEAPKDTTVSIPLTAPVTPASTPAPPSDLSPVAEIAPATVEPIAQSTTPTPTIEAPATPALPPAPPAQVPSNITQPSVYAPVQAKAIETPPVPPKAVEPAPATEVITEVITASAVAPKPSPTVPTKTESKAKPVAQTNERFSASHASKYAVQIVTLSSLKAVNAYIKTHGLQDCQSFRQQRDGKELFSLTCGLYPNREAALAAVSQLPSSINAAKPYPRQIADIRKVMLP